MLEGGGGFYLDAFFELSTERPPSDVKVTGDKRELVVRALPFASIDRYAARFGINDVDEFTLFLRVIRAMDRELIDIQTNPETNP